MNDSHDIIRSGNREAGVLRASDRADRPAAVLLVSPDPIMVQAVRRSITDEPGGVALRVTEDAVTAAAMIADEPPALVLVDASLPEAGMRAIGGVCRGLGSTVAALLDPCPTLDRLASAMRAGLRDVIDPAREQDLRGEIRRVLGTASDDNAPALKVAFPSIDASDTDELTAAELEAPDPTANELMAIAGDLAEAYSGLGKQAGKIALASELNGVLRQELEVESLLRTLLEFLLARVGPTNAGIFLPTSDGDFSLGAYINYDVPRDSAETMLEQLSATVAPAFEHSATVALADNDADVERLFGEAHDWFEGSAVAAVGCHGPQDGESLAGEPAGELTGGVDDPECLAVLCLFRDRAVGFDDAAIETLQIASDLFGKQLARVVKVHNRLDGDDLGAF